MTEQSFSLDRQTKIIKRSDNLPKERKIEKHEIEVLPMWFGRRRLDDSDYGAFYNALSFYSQLNMRAIFALPDADGIKKIDSKIMGSFPSDLKNVLDGIQKPLVVFVVSTAQSAERPWLAQFPQKLLEYRKKTNQKDDTFVYNIIMGGWFSEPNRLKDPEGHFWSSELRAHMLNAVYLKYDTDAPTAGSQRLVEFMNRIVGMDLTKQEFPNYTMEDIKKMAWHINRECFNAIFEPDRFIPKYNIDPDGRPRFPF